MPTGTLPLPRALAQRCGRWTRTNHMASVQALLRRVAKLETARTPRPSPIVQLYGSVDGFAEGAEGLDRVDFPLVVAALRRWEADRVYDHMHRQRNGFWESSVR